MVERVAQLLLHYERRVLAVHPRRTGPDGYERSAEFQLRDGRLNRPQVLRHAGPVVRDWPRATHPVYVDVARPDDRDHRRRDYYELLRGQAQLRPGHAPAFQLRQRAIIRLRSRRADHDPGYHVRRGTGDSHQSAVSL